LGSSATCALARSQFLCSAVGTHAARLPVFLKRRQALRARFGKKLAEADAAADELQAALAHAAAPALPSVTPHGEVTHLSKVPVLPAEEAFAWQTAFRVELL
jgi:hypothetical protein